MNSHAVLFCLLLSLLFLSLIASAASYPPFSEEDLRKEAKQLQNDGKYKEALALFTRLLENPETNPLLLPTDLGLGVNCLHNLNRIDELDAFLDKAVAGHADNWRLINEAGQQYMQIPHYGYMVAGKFQRGNVRGSGQYMDCQQRDRVRALQLMRQAMALTADEENASDRARFHLNFANYLMSGREGPQSWRLQTLTDLECLPDYEEGHYRGYYGSNYVAAPVDVEGKPIFYGVPESFADAGNDGERWRWLLEEARRIAPDRTQEVNYYLAHFLHSQFGVQTMARYSHFFSRDRDDTQDSTFALHTLTEQETMANLATGVKRFDLPEEFNFIKIFRAMAEDKRSGYGETAADTLANIFENRRQYAKAAECWLESIERYGPGHNRHKEQRRKQIIDPSGRLEPTPAQAAGQGAVIDYRFRNGKRVSFEAHEIDVEKLLADVKAYIKSNPDRLDWQKMNINHVGARVLDQNETQYVGERVAGWDLDLSPREGHFDQRITITTPMQKAGAYLLTARMQDGNTSQVVLWVNDTAIVQKPLDKGVFYFVADARTGEPVPRANVESFGYRTEWLRDKSRNNSRNKLLVHTTNFSGFTDLQGQLFLDEEDLSSNYQWLTIARTDQGRLAYLGFNNVWFRGSHTPRYDQARSFLITDRPVYRPNQEVKFKCWTRHTRYDLEDQSLYANQSITLRINDPMGEEFLVKNYTSDEYGGFDGAVSLPGDAKLGVYQVWTPYGSSHFRVEEYKKPEFEVLVEAPTEPALLGDEITATIKAKYYFGAPVTEATVSYKVLRSAHDGKWFPFGRWDWFYGPGYWWFGYDYYWYPGWGDWGTCRPRYAWNPWRSEEPEVVMEKEVPIGPDGTVEIKIDTAFAKEIHGNQDHSYQITAEVRDASRRTIVGQGKVLAARKPFKVYTWVDRGYYRVGDTVNAECTALTLDQKPVAGKGEARLFKITYPDTQQPKETEVRTWPVETDAEGQARVKLSASEPGQYRLSFTVTDTKGRSEEGAYLFCVRGEGFDGSQFRFNHLELVLDKKEYAPGDTVKLMINTDRTDSTVVLFLKPCEGVYPTPLILPLNGKSVVVPVEVIQKDMPNFFVEAFTVSNGRLHTETREIVVPPEKRMLNVEVLPSAEVYKPGAEATVRIFLKDLAGKPVQGSTALALYDRSLDYIAGGSNVPEIKEFFWKWRKNHYPAIIWSMHSPGSNEAVYTQPMMNNIGVFGHIVPTVDFAEGERAMPASAPMEDGATEKLGALGYGGGSSGKKRMRAMNKSVSQGDDLYEAKEEMDMEMPADPEVQPTVRSQFADTAFWAGTLNTDADGLAEVTFTMPENLTGWKVSAWAVTHGTRVGQAQTEVKTSKDLLLRMQAPRFFVEKDEVVLSANVHNYLDAEKAVKTRLELDGDCLSLMGEAEQSLSIGSHGEARVDWRVKVDREGEAVIRMLALTDEESDAMEMRFPVYVHGMAKTVSFSGGLRSDQGKAGLTFSVPEERRISESHLVIRYSPSVACAMVDALPYLADYPYGCTEQTLNRFLPAVITQKTLLEMGLDLEAIRDKQVNLNAQQIGDPAERAAQWQRWKRNPVFDRAVVNDMVAQGLKRLTNMQLSDGGWGWFSGWGEYSSPHTTSVVVHGLQIARENDVALVPGMLDRGIAWLENYQRDQVQHLKNEPKKIKPWKRYADNLDAFIYMILGDEGKFDPDMGRFLYRDRLKLSSYGQSMFGLALHKEGREEELRMVIDNIKQLLREDAENQTAYLDLRSGSWCWWYWHGSEYESNAYLLKLLARTEPKGSQAAGLAKYLINNRRHGTWWNSTRDTALCIEALAEFIRASGESRPDMTVKILIDGQQHKEVKITAENLFTFDGTLELRGDAVETGEHEIVFEKTGTGPLYFNAYLTYFSLEDHITRAGLEVKVNRKFYKLVEVDKEIDVAGSHGQALSQKVEKYERHEIANLDTLKSGDLVEIELEIDSKNDYEYLVFEDMKAAGFEPVEVRSGYVGGGLHAYMELRDEKVCFFARTLPAGKHSVAYRMRAEIPGRFSALPTRAFAMYAPELKGNSDEIKVKIVD